MYDDRKNCISHRPLRHRQHGACLPDKRQICLTAGWNPIRNGEDILGKLSVSVCFDGLGWTDLWSYKRPRRLFGWNIKVSSVLRLQLLLTVLTCWYPKPEDFRGAAVFSCQSSHPKIWAKPFFLDFEASVFDSTWKHEVTSRSTFGWSQDAATSGVKSG